MDIDFGLLAACVKAGRVGLKQLSDNGISEEMLAGQPARQLFNFIRSHTKEHGATPSPDFLQMKLGIVLPEVTDPPSVFVKEIRRRHLWNLQVQFLQEFGDLVNERKIEEAQARQEQFQRELRSASATPASVTSIWSAAEDVIQAYTDAKAGKMGVPTPWPTLNRMTMGWGAGDFIVFVARLGIGKTWALLMMAEYAWKNGYHVLFISPEMAKYRLAMRAFALNLGMSYSNIRSGQLGDLQEPTFLKRVREMEGEQGFDVLGSNFRCTPQNIEDALAVVRPDILFVDGLYLVKGEGRNRTESTANVADELKMMAGHYEIPVVTSTQFNRDVKRNDPSTVDVGSIGVSDVIGWDADNAYAIVQTDDMRTNRELMMRPVKAREGGEMSDLWLNWDFDKMLFTEQGQERSDTFTDQEFDKYAQEATEDSNALLDEMEKRKGDDGIPF